MGVLLLLTGATCSGKSTAMKLLGGRRVDVDCHDFEPALGALDPLAKRRPEVAGEHVRHQRRRACRGGRLAGRLDRSAGRRLASGPSTPQRHLVALVATQVTERSTPERSSE